MGYFLWGLLIYLYHVSKFTILTSTFVFTVNNTIINLQLEELSLAECIRMKWPARSGNISFSPCALPPNPSPNLTFFQKVIPAFLCAKTGLFYLVSNVMCQVLCTLVLLPSSVVVLARFFSFKHPSRYVATLWLVNKTLFCDL